MKTRLPERYRDIEHFQASTGITLPASEQWRLCPHFLGEIHGLPQTHGALLATNGILCYIELVAPINGLTFFLGHLDFFVPMNISYLNEVKEMVAKDPTKPRPKKVDQLVADLLGA